MSQAPGLMINPLSCSVILVIISLYLINLKGSWKHQNVIILAGVCYIRCLLYQRLLKIYSYKTTRALVLKTCFIESVIRLEEVAFISNTTILLKIKPKYRAYSSCFEMFISTEDVVLVVRSFAQQLWRWILKLVNTQCNKAILQEEALLLQGSTR